MTVKELKALLDSFNDDVEVHMAYPAGDYWRTTLAPSVRRVELGEVAHNEYHRCDSQVDDEKEPSRTVLLIR